MTTHALNLSELVKNYKIAKNKDEEALAILDIVQYSKTEGKEEVLKEVNLANLATKSDIKDVELLIEKTKFSLIKWMFAMVCIPIVFDILARHFGF